MLSFDDEELVSPLLLTTASGCLLFSFALAWLASLIYYAEIGVLKRLFPVPHNIIRAHVDYLLMAVVLIAVHYVRSQTPYLRPGAAEGGFEATAVHYWVACGGAVYNPLGFIAMAAVPSLGKPKTLGARLFVLVGFVPATIGFCAIWLHLFNASSAAFR